MKKAFTLIELLVVIAIIAILAAILFPVFAQAKLQAKKTTTVSNVKQEMLAELMYSNDVDDTAPMAMGVRPDGTGTWGVGLLHPVPYNVVAESPWQQPERYLTAQAIWANSMLPYTKNYGILQVTASKNVNYVPDTFLAGVTPVPVGLTYNGLFHCLAGSAVTAPANAVTFWEVQALNYIGRGFSSPALDCGNVAGVGALQSNPIACGFNPGGPASSNGSGNGSILYVVNGTDTVWSFGEHQIVGFADGHAKSGTCGSTIAPAVAAPSGQIVDPWAQVGTTGTPVSYWNCGVGGPTDQGSSALYACFFRPDRTW